ncbi:MAG: hypothetical protein A3I66_22605 [Burkholderiales bacterium RIFCSPLOWO2_02_FULL_57_36]|nr:MAG: hypothetical protein A3I66_22605 [Burkholderiales bacterium RIFCSPLOWO2_02_FULL_57_36]
MQKAVLINRSEKQGREKCDGTTSVMRINQNKKIDEKEKLPHNLISLLLTNKTICWKSEAR